MQTGTDEEQSPTKTNPHVYILIDDVGMHCRQFAPTLHWSRLSVANKNHANHFSRSFDVSVTDQGAFGHSYATHITCIHVGKGD